MIRVVSIGDDKHGVFGFFHSPSEHSSWYGLLKVSSSRAIEMRCFCNCRFLFGSIILYLSIEQTGFGEKKKNINIILWSCQKSPTSIGTEEEPCKNNKCFIVFRHRLSSTRRFFQCSRVWMEEICVKKKNRDRTCTSFFLSPTKRIQWKRW